MTDIELLTAAAKAAKQPIEFTNGVPVSFIENGALVSAWNPLEDDGDALRLAVKLGIQLMFNQPCVYANHFWENMEADLNAATRRAIVRAAASIGKAML